MSRLRRNELLALALVLGLGLLHLPFPFNWDQALFTLGARRLAAGGVLYRDFWDIKQPGIYWFYQAAGRLFGFHEVGIHLFELLWMMAFAVTLLVTLRRRWGPGLAATLAPLLSVGAYYAATGDVHLTKVEGLVGFPLYLTLWFATDADGVEPRARRLFVSGLCGAVVLLFKLIFAPIVGAFWLIALVGLWRRRGAVRALAVVALPAALGLALPLGAMLAYFARYHLLGVLWWTYVIYPGVLITHAQGSHTARVSGSIVWFLLRFSPLLGLAIMGAGVARARRDWLGLGLALWAALAIPIIFVQRWSGWEYHYLLFVVPLGLLGAVGIGGLWTRLDRLGLEAPAARRVVAAGLVALFAGLIGIAAVKTVLLVRDGCGLTAAGRAAYRTRMGPFYATTLRDVAFLDEPGRVAGPVFALGNPLVYLLARRPAAPAFDCGTFPAEWGEREWSALTSRLERVPPAYLLVDVDYLPLLRGDRPPAGPFAAFLVDRYRALRTSDLGVWYERVR
jgi:hypothetical protein